MKTKAKYISLINNGNENISVAVSLESLAYQHLNSQ
jgi:hypothetical protein